ncbi:MAG: beta-galactosidase [Chloroflexi bacterium]|nr:beta-galactosidase [Chloroflexota bacterium]
MSTYFEVAARPVFAADFHYFRLPREKWELMLTRLRQMGINSLTLTLPWGFHEVEPGAVDLIGTRNSRRDIAGLLQLAAALDFVCILKPGPYAAAGVLGDGLPAWLLKQSDDLDAALPAAVSGWYQAISQALAGQQWPNGPIIALHVEAEPDWAKPQTLHPQLTEVKWRIWLRKRYERIEALNAAYGTAYRTVNEVKFPENWAAGTAPLEQDARAFLETVQSDTQASYRQILLDSGWQIPIYSSTPASDPPWRNLNLTNLAELTTLSLTQKKAVERPFLNLHQAIQVDPDPADVGRGPVWAEGAPIRTDGSVRPAFWQVRQYLWLNLLPDDRLDAQTLVVSSAHGRVISRSGDASLKVDLSSGAKSNVYRLRFTGELVADDNLKVSRGKLSGPYLAEDAVSQTDLILSVKDAAAPSGDFLSTYLGHLLTAQAQTLTRCAALAVSLAQMLAPGQANPEPAAPTRPATTSYVLEEARHGLRDADAALRKALASISELEGGFATILGKERSSRAAAPAEINPSIFDGPARDVLTEVGAACAKIGPALKAVGDELQRALASRTGLTVTQYQQGYTAAVAAAHAAREPLLQVISLLRLEIAAERLPLPAWRVHNQVQELAESLRWGVLRGEDRR